MLLYLLLFAFAIACIVVGRLELAGIERYISYYAGIVGLFCLVFLREYLIARFRGGNWLAGIHATGVFLKFQLERLSELDAQGKTVLAIATARRLYGYDLAQAKEFVENLRESSPPA